MVNISLLEKSIPVAPIKIAALKSCSQLASQVDAHLVQFRKELNSHNQSGLNLRGYAEDTFLIECNCPRLAQERQKESSTNPSEVLTCMSWLMYAIIALHIICAVMRITCHQTITIRI